MTIPASWFIQVLNMSIGAAWAALLVMAGRLLLRRAPKSFSYALWSVVLFRLVCPVSFTSIFSLMPRPQTVPQEIVSAARPEIQSGFSFIDQAVNSSLPPAPPAAAVNPVQLWLELGSLVWQAGMVLMLAYCVISYLRFRRRLREAVLREGNVWESDRIPTAFVLGLLRPRIYLPLGLTEEERRYILCHEEIHIRRRDYLVKPLALLLLCVHWFNPVLWAAYLLMCQDMEMSCDEAVMSLLGTEVRKGYSSSLLAISERQNGLVSPLAFGENDVKSRIKNVLRYKKPALWGLIAAAALGAVLAFCLLADPKGEAWTALSGQQGLPFRDMAGAESILVERQGTGSVPIEDPGQVEQLEALVSALEVGEEPLTAGEQAPDWELRLTFRRSDAAAAESLALCFTQTQVWGETDGERGQSYALRESEPLYRMVEEYTFLLDPADVWGYQVGFQEILDGEGQRYLLVTEPLVGSRLASLLLDGTLLEEKPGQTPQVSDYLFISMGRPGTPYYVYEAEGRYFVERPEDYRLEITEETYREIRSIWRTVARREAPDETNGYYTGYEETVDGVRLRKFAGYQGEYATRLAELILGGTDVPLNPLEMVVPVDSYLRIEVRDPGSAYYVYEEDGHYYAEQLTSYRVELTQDAYQEIRDIYLDAAMESLQGEAAAFHADGGMADAARVGIEGYYAAFTAEDIPEELRILRFTVGEITPMAGDMNEFAVSFLWDYDTTGISRWLSANGNGAPVADGWHWTENYQEFRFRRIRDREYAIIGMGTGGGGQGLAPIQTEGAAAQPNAEQNAQKDELDKLDEEFDRQQAEEYAAHGVTKNGKEYYYQGQLVNIFLDRRPDSSFYALEINPAGTVNIQILRGADGTITGVAYLTEAERNELFGDDEEPAAGTGSGLGPPARFRAENIPEVSPDNDFASVNALCDYLRSRLTEDQYTVMGSQRGGETGSRLVAQIVAPDIAPIERLLLDYTGKAVPVEYRVVPFSGAQLRQAESAMKDFLSANPEIRYYIVGNHIEYISVQLPEENSKLTDFIAAYPVKDIYHVSIYPDGLPLNPD